MGINLLKKYDKFIVASEDNTITIWKTSKIAIQEIYNNLTHIYLVNLTIR